MHNPFHQTFVCQLGMQQFQQFCCTAWALHAYLVILPEGGGGGGARPLTSEEEEEEEERLPWSHVR